MMINNQINNSSQHCKTNWLQSLKQAQLFLIQGQNFKIKCDQNIQLNREDVKARCKTHEIKKLKLRKAKKRINRCTKVMVECGWESVSHSFHQGLYISMFTAHLTLHQWCQMWNEHEHLQPVSTHMQYEQVCNPGCKFFSFFFYVIQETRVWFNLWFGQLQVVKIEYFGTLSALSTPAITTLRPTDETQNIWGQFWVIMRWRYE